MGAGNEEEERGGGSFLYFVKVFSFFIELCFLSAVRTMNLKPGSKVILALINLE